MATGLASPSNGMSQAISGASHAGVPTVAPCACSTATAFLTAPSFSAGWAAFEIRTRTFCTRSFIAHLQSEAKQVISPTMEQRVIVIIGPTGSGKSALALALADRHRGTVINADAMQTYDAFPMLTAQPTLAERRRVPHA